MTMDLTLRIVLLAGLLVLCPIGLDHRMKSQPTGERLDPRQEGLFILATLRPVGLVYMVGIIAYLIDPAWMAWSAVPLPSSLRWAGAALGAFGGALLL